jgi:hypothetical protein
LLHIEGAHMGRAFSNVLDQLCHVGELLPVIFFGIFPGFPETQGEYLRIGSPGHRVVGGKTFVIIVVKYLIILPSSS